MVWIRSLLVGAGIPVVLMAGLVGAAPTSAAPPAVPVVAGGVPAAPPAPAAPVVPTVTVAQAAPRNVLVSVSRQTVTWAMPSKLRPLRLVGFQVSYRKTAKSKPVVVKLTAKKARTDSGYGWEIPTVARGQVQVRAQVSSGKGKKKKVSWTKWVAGRTAWGTNVSVVSAAAAAGQTVVRVSTNAQRVNAAFTNPDRSGETRVSGTPTLGAVEFTVSGVFRQVTLTGVTNSKPGTPALFSIAVSSIDNARVVAIEPTRVSLAWDVVGQAQVTAVRRTNGTTPATSPTDGTGVSVAQGGTGIDDRDVQGGRGYTYTVFSTDGTGAALPPVPIQAHTPSSATDPRAGDGTWVFQPDVVQPTENQFATLTPQQVATMPAPDERSLLDSNSYLWLESAFLSSDEFLGRLVVLPISDDIPAGFIGKIVQVEGERVAVIQMPVGSVFTSVDVPLSTDSPQRGGSATTVRPTVLDWDCDGDLESGLPFELEAGRPRMAPGSFLTGNQMSASLVMDVTVSAKAQITAGYSCTLAIVEEDITVPAPIPLLMKVDMDLTVGVEGSGSASYWSQTYRANAVLSVSTDDLGIAGSVRVELAEQDTTGATEWSVKAFAEQSATGTFGPGAGAGGGPVEVGAVAGSFFRLIPRFVVEPTPGSEVNEPQDWCATAEVELGVERGVRAELWFDGAWWDWSPTIEGGLVNDIPVIGKRPIWCWGDSAGLTMDGLPISVQLAPGATKRIPVQGVKAGEFVSVWGHGSVLVGGPTIRVVDSFRPDKYIRVGQNAGGVLSSVDLIPANRPRKATYEVVMVNDTDTAFTILLGASSPGEDTVSVGGEPVTLETPNHGQVALAPLSAVTTQGWLSLSGTAPWGLWSLYDDKGKRVTTWTSTGFATDEQVRTFSYLRKLSGSPRDLTLAFWRLDPVGPPSGVVVAETLQETGLTVNGEERDFVTGPPGQTVLVPLRGVVPGQRLLVSGTLPVYAMRWTPRVEVYAPDGSPLTWFKTCGPTVGSEVMPCSGYIDIPDTAPANATFVVEIHTFTDIQDEYGYKLWVTGADGT